MAGVNAGIRPSMKQHNFQKGEAVHKPTALKKTTN